MHKHKLTLNEEKNDNKWKCNGCNKNDKIKFTCNRCIDFNFCKECNEKSEIEFVKSNQSYNYLICNDCNEMSVAKIRCECKKCKSETIFIKKEPKSLKEVLKNETPIFCFSCYDNDYEGSDDEYPDAEKEKENGICIFFFKCSKCSSKNNNIVLEIIRNAKKRICLICQDNEDKEKCIKLTCGKIF
jgi:hypothetical protein